MAFARVALPFLMLLPAAPLLARQAAPVKLVVREGSREIGREEHSFQSGRARGAPGSTLTASASYPSMNPSTRLSAVVERTPELAIAKFQLEVEGPEGPTFILAAGSGARLIVRTVARGSESGRELPGGPDVVLLDDQVHSLMIPVADLATPAGRPLTAIFPRTGRRASFTARRDAGSGGSQRIALTGDITGTLVLDQSGHLERLELPARSLTVTRAE